MSEWTDTLASSLGVATLDLGQQAALLNASRQIAHRVERKETPLSTYLMGVAAGVRIAGGASPPDALEGVVDLVLSLLPPEGPNPGP